MGKELAIEWPRRYFGPPVEQDESVLKSMGWGGILRPDLPTDIVVRSWPRPTRCGLSFAFSDYLAFPSLKIVQVAMVNCARMEFRLTGIGKEDEQCSQFWGG